MVIGIDVTRRLRRERNYAFVMMILSAVSLIIEIVSSDAVSVGVGFVALFLSYNVVLFYFTARNAALALEDTRLSIPDP